MTLDWETAYATAFQIQTSPDGTNWTTIYSTTTGTGGTQTLSRLRHRPVHPDVRHRPGHPVRLQPVGVRRLHHRCRRHPHPDADRRDATGSGAPPASFWGNTSAIPAASNVLEVSIVNQTNGQYPDSQVYWSFNGQEESIAQQPYIDMPANSAGRMYFYLGSPNSPYYDFIEFEILSPMP